MTSAQNDWLAHHGVKGQKWGVRNGPPYPLKDNTLFISGSWKTQQKGGQYERADLHDEIKKYLDNIPKDTHIVIGDAPGIDTQVQNYLKKINYENVTVYGPGDAVRYKANDNWKSKPIPSKYELGSDKWKEAKDLEMSKVATSGLAIVIDNGSQATRNNIARLQKNGKPVQVFEIRADKNDNWLSHHGVEGQKWGVKNGPPYPIQKEHFTSDTRVTKNNKTAINEIFSTMPMSEKKKIWVGYNSKSPKDFFGNDEYDNGGTLYSIVQYKKKVPVSFLVVGDDMYNGHRVGNIGLGVRNDPAYRQKGISTKMASKTVDWFNKQSKIDQLWWYARVDNPGSWKIAEKLNFKHVEDFTEKDGKKYKSYILEK